MLIKPCPPCCTTEFADINVPDNFFDLKSDEQQNLLGALLNSHPEWKKTIDELIKFINAGNRLSKL